MTVVLMVYSWFPKIDVVLWADSLHGEFRNIFFFTIYKTLKKGITNHIIELKET